MGEEALANPVPFGWMLFVPEKIWKEVLSETNKQIRSAVCRFEIRKQLSGG